jgi:hypothetical protein
MIGAVGGMGPHRVWTSPDGLRWGKPEIHENIGGRCDTRNNLTWVPERNEWMLISRVGFTPRDIGRSASKDFHHWTPIEQVLEPEPGQPEFHDMAAFRYEGIYLGLLGVFDTQADRQWTELAWSPDSLHWHHLLPGTPFIPNSEQEGQYDWGCIFADQPFIGDSEIRIYYSAGNGRFFGWRDASLCLATIGLDRWAGYRSEAGKVGSVLTQEVLCHGPKLTITADAEGGSVDGTIVDETGKELVRITPLTTDATDQVVADVSSMVGRRVQIRFELEDATIYSYGFVD